MLVGKASSKADKAAGEAASNACSINCVTDSEASGVTICRLLRGTDGRQWWMGHGKLS